MEILYHQTNCSKLCFITKGAVNVVYWSPPNSLLRSSSNTSTRVLPMIYKYRQAS